MRQESCLLESKASSGGRILDIEAWTRLAKAFAEYKQR